VTRRRTAPQGVEDIHNNNNDDDNRPTAGATSNDV
jgi:hypothetical protein